MKSVLIGTTIFLGCALPSSGASVRWPPKRETGCVATALDWHDLPRVCNTRRMLSPSIRRYLSRLPTCEEADVGDICEGSGECGTSDRLDNCGGFDLYHKSGGHGQHDSDYEEHDSDHEEDSDSEHSDHDDHDEDEDSDHDGHDEEEEQEEEEEEEETGSDSGGGSGVIEDGPAGPIADFKWPQYSQQCRDDAGPPFADDIPGRPYHASGKSRAVLQDGKCPPPLEGACAARGGTGHEATRAAFLEGPLQCGGKGWFCRILPDPEHAGGDQSDWNFNHCNRSDYGDTDGHCHGSDNDDVYYWWVRDHYHRNYAGRLHCCCDWNAVKDVVARCDYRAPLQPGENQRCRDANEDHTGPGSGFSMGYEAGCSNLGTRDPLPEPPASQCWDVKYFAPGGR